MAIQNRKSHSQPIKVVNIMKDGRRLDSLEGIEAPDLIYDIILRDYLAQGIELEPVGD